MSSIYSDAGQLEHIAKIIRRYCQLPVSSEFVPGAFLEAVLAHVHDAEVLRTYDYVDVIDRKGRRGWSIKSTLERTPMTWKRAKLANKERLIDDSMAGDEGLQTLGDTIIDFCNKHAAESMQKYGLDELGYARLIVFPDREARYFERILCTRDNPVIFEPRDFRWVWSTERVNGVKEQLSALHGYHIASNRRWWAWHGRGENQLHFTGERQWWPALEDHAIRFTLPAETDRLSFDRLLEVLDAL